MGKAAKMACRKMGGRMRNIGGVKAPAYGSNDKVTRMAAGPSEGFVGDAGIGAEGRPIGGGNSRPGRKFGGRLRGHKRDTDKDGDNDHDEDDGYASGGWIAGATKNKGALHRALHVPEGETIPAKKLAKAAQSGSPLMRKRVALAKTLKGLHK